MGEVWREHESIYIILKQFKLKVDGVAVEGEIFGDPTVKESAFDGAGRPIDFVIIAEIIRAIRGFLAMDFA
jgi:hypothetical protein